jgi:hypothetical protein
VGELPDGGVGVPGIVREVDVACTSCAQRWLVDLILNIVGLLFGLAIAVMEHRRANKAEARSQSAEAQLQNLLKSLPTEFLKVFLEHEANKSERTSSSDRSIEISYADLNGDGRDELIVEFISGPHNTAIHVFGSWGVHGEIYSSTPMGFYFADVDNDGAMEVISSEVSMIADLPYVMGFRDKVIHKLTPEGFVEVSREPCFTNEDLKEAIERAKAEENNSRDTDESTTTQP